MAKKHARIDLTQHLTQRLAPLSAKAPFILRITEWRETPISRSRRADRPSRAPAHPRGSGLLALTHHELRSNRQPPTANRWALSGLRTMLGGQAKDKGVQDMLERLRLAA